MISGLASGGLDVEIRPSRESGGNMRKHRIENAWRTPEDKRCVSTANINLNRGMSRLVDHRAWVYNVKRRSKGRPYHFREGSVGIEARNGGAGSRVSVKKFFSTRNRKPVLKLHVAMVGGLLSKHPPDAAEYVTTVLSDISRIFPIQFVRKWQSNEVSEGGKGESRERRRWTGRGGKRVCKK